VQQLRLKRNDAEHFLLRHPQPSDYDLLVEEEAVIYKEDGSVLVRLVKDAVDAMACEVAYRHLKTVDGALSARASVLGTKLQPRILSDGSKGKTMVVPPEVVARARQLGAKADFLGYKEAEPRYKFCRQTVWTREHPEVLRASMPLIRAADCIFKIEFPAEWEKQHDHVSKAPDYRIGETAFSTLTVNKNLPTTYHRDEGDYRKGFGVMLTLGSFTGGFLCFPAYRVAVNYQPGDVLLADVHEIHGNTKMKGSRVVCVLYAREKINQCGSVEEETEKGMRHMVAQARHMTKAQMLEAEDQEPLDDREFYTPPEHTPEQRAELEQRMARQASIRHLQSNALFSGKEYQLLTRTSFESLRESREEKQVEICVALEKLGHSHGRFCQKGIALRTTMESSIFLQQFARHGTPIVQPAR
jgi:hypothetical protein